MPQRLVEHDYVEFEIIPGEYYVKGPEGKQLVEVERRWEAVSSYTGRYAEESEDAVCLFVNERKCFQWFPKKAVRITR